MSIKTVFGALSFASFLLILGSVGAMERNTISFWQGVVQAFLSAASFILFMYLAGGFKEKKGRR